MQSYIANQDNILTADLLDPTAVPITSGTITGYLYCLSGDSVGKYWRASDNTWQASESSAGAMTHITDGHWQVTIDELAWVSGVRYLFYAKANTDYTAYSNEVVEGGIHWVDPADVGITGALVVSVDYAKQHLRVTGTSDDAYIAALILAVQTFAEAWQGRTWLRTTRTQTFDCFPSVMRLNHPPLAAITSIQYVDIDGVTQTLASSVYRVDTVSEPGRVTLEYNQTWPATRSVTNAVTVTYTAGFATAADVPQTWKQAVLLGVGHLYNHRESVSEETMAEVPQGFYALLWPDKTTYRESLFDMWG